MHLISPLFYALTAYAAVAAGPGRRCAVALIETAADHPGFVRIKRRTPVVAQYTHECTYLGAFGYTENLLRRRFHLGWFYVHLLDRHFQRVMGAALRSPAHPTVHHILGLMDPPETEAPLVIGDWNGRSAFNLIAEVGLVDRKDYTFDAGFRSALGFDHHGVVKARASTAIGTLILRYEGVFRELARLQRDRVDDTHWPRSSIKSWAGSEH